MARDIDDQTLEVHDGRRAGWHWAQHQIIDIHGAELGPYGLAIYYALCRHTDVDRSCWPSYATLAKETGMTRRQAIHQMNRLIRMGLVTKEPRKDEAGDPTSNRYTITDLVPTKGGDEGDALGSEGDSPPLVNQVHQGSEGDSPKGEPPKNNHLEDIPSSIEEGAPPPPAIPSRNKSTDPQLKHPACQIYRHFARLTAKEAARPLLIAACEQVGEDAFREGVAEWMANWSPHNVTGLCDRILKGGNGRGPPGGNRYRSTATRRSPPADIPDRCDECGQYGSWCYCGEREPALVDDEE